MLCRFRLDGACLVRRSGSCFPPCPYCVWRCFMGARLPRFQSGASLRSFVISSSLEALPLSDSEAFSVLTSLGCVRCSGLSFGEDFFLIVPEHVSRLLIFEVCISALGAGSRWGFASEYARCGCGEAVRISPDSWSWRPDFWDSEDGFFCGDCVRGSADLSSRYFAWVRRQGFPVCSLMSPAAFGFCLGPSVSVSFGAPLPASWPWAGLPSGSFVLRVFPEQFSCRYEAWSAPALSGV